MAIGKFWQGDSALGEIYLDKLFFSNDIGDRPRKMSAVGVLETLALGALF